MEEQLAALLRTVASRCFWSRAPQTPAPARPYVVMHRISGVRGYTFEGDDGLVESRVQIDVFADTYTSARSTADLITATLSGHRDSNFRAIFIDTERSLPGLDGSDPDELFRISIDAIVWHRAPALPEPAPAP